MFEVPVSGPTRPVWRLRGWVAAWLAAVLALAPLAQPTAFAAAAVCADAPEWVASRDDDGRAARAPTAGSRPLGPAGQGILSRSMLAEAACAPPPAKPPLLRPLAAAEPPVAARAIGPTAHVARAAFDRSSVGSARTPTGPPA